MRISDWSSDVCSSDLELLELVVAERQPVVLDLRQRRYRDARLRAHLLEGPAVAAADAAHHGAQRRGVRSGRHQFFHSMFDNFPIRIIMRSEEHTSELQSLMRTSSAVFC